MDENGVKRYDKQVLGCLLDKYENSLLHMEKNQVQIRIVYPVKKVLSRNILISFCGSEPGFRKGKVSVNIRYGSAGRICRPL